MNDVLKRMKRRHRYAVRCYLCCGTSDAVPVLRKLRVSLDHGLCLRSTLIVKMDRGVQAWWRIFATLPTVFTTKPCVFAPQETENWKVIEVMVPGYVCYGWDDGSTAMLCASQICQIRHSWENLERCTAVLTSFMMVCSVCMPLGGMTKRITPQIRRW